MTEMFLLAHSVSVSVHPNTLTHKPLYRPISQTMFMLSIAINRANHVCTTVIIKHNYMLMCNHKIVIKHNVVFVKQYRTYISQDL